MYKNRLKEIMSERDISNHRLCKETMISRQTISKIKNNEFHDISVNVLTDLLSYFNLSFEEFGTMYSRSKGLQILLKKKVFDEKHLSFLESLIIDSVNVSCYFEPYASNTCLNFRSKGFYKKFEFSGNLRINTRLHGLTLEVIDFNLYKKNKNFTFEEFHTLYNQMFLQLEKYATILGFTQIVINIDSYLDDSYNSIVEPRYVNKYDLEYLINKSNTSSYSRRESELMKVYIVKNLGYSEILESDIQEKKNSIDEYVDSLSKIDFFDKEKKRFYILEKEGIEPSYYTRIFLKVINTEIIPKYKLEHDRYKRYNIPKSSK